jgi:amidase
LTIMTTDLPFLTISELARRLRSRQLTSGDVTRAELDRITNLDGALGSYSRVMAEEARSAADAADSKIAAGQYRGPLHGVPIAIKDLCYTKGIPTAAGMAIHRSFCPGKDATVVARLKEAGAVLLGKLQMTEGAYSDYHPSNTPPKNPWDANYWPVISSSGPAVATAAGLCYGSVASDTGGSIRWPCGANGLTGLKPTWGRVSRFGVVELAASLDHVGPIARSAVDAAMLLSVLAGHDANDPTSLTTPVPDYSAATTQGLDGLRLGVDWQWIGQDVHSSVQAALLCAIKIFGALNAEIVDSKVPDTIQSVVDWAPLCAVEAAVAHEVTYPARRNEYGPVLASVLETGRRLSGMDYQKIVLRRMDLRGRVGWLFRSIGLLLAPVHPFAPLSLSDIRTLGEQPELIRKLQRYTAPFNMTGNPTITLPGGFSDRGLPIGFQLVAPHLGDTNLIQAGVAYQRVTDFHERPSESRNRRRSNFEERDGL